MCQAKSCYHAELISQAITGATGLESFGYFLFNEEFALPERHLGLCLAHDRTQSQRYLECIDVIADELAKTVKLDKLLERLGTRRQSRRENPFIREEPVTQESAASLSACVPILKHVPVKQKVRPRLALIRDKAFSFYYSSSLTALERYFEVCEISALKDEELINCDACYIGGGYPELFASSLSANKRFMFSLRRAIEEGLPVYAECGGYLYLLSRLITKEGLDYEMVGVLPGFAKMGNIRSRQFGYVHATLEQDTPFLKRGTSLRAHEFHYSSIEGEQGIVSCRKPHSEKSWTGGSQYKNVFASYLHLDLASHPDLLEGIYAKACEYRSLRGQE